MTSDQRRASMYYVLAQDILHLEKICGLRRVCETVMALSFLNKTLKQDILKVTISDNGGNPFFCGAVACHIE